MNMANYSQNNDGRLKYRAALSCSGIPISSCREQPAATEGPPPWGTETPLASEEGGERGKRKEVGA